MMSEVHFSCVGGDDRSVELLLVIVLKGSLLESSVGNKVGSEVTASSAFIPLKSGCFSGARVGFGS
jgi:hypothetical protein